MKRLVLFCFVFISLTIQAKTTYIPKYRSYIHIVDKSDTISVANVLPELVLDDKNGMFSIRLEHEIVTDDKIKAIKRAKRAAGWAT